MHSRIDYCSFIYQSASKVNLKRLDVLQNQCLRIVTGARQTTPIMSLKVEAGVPPLEIRSAFLGIKYYNKILELPEDAGLVKILSRGINNEVGCLKRMQYIKKIRNVSPVPP